MGTEGKPLLGAFGPGRLPVDAELVYVRADRPRDALGHAGRIRAAGRLPLVTVEPWGGHPDPTGWRAWTRAFAGGGDVLVRYQHEMNGVGWYPWQGDPNRHVREWRDFAGRMPRTVAALWSPNVSFPGSRPIADFWPGADVVDAVGLSGYARDGESPAELFGPSLAELRALAPGKPVWIAETAAPRGPKQLRYARALAAFAEAQGLAGVVWFNTRKEGVEEADWRLSDAAANAFLGREARPRREPREPRERTGR